jgi:hypothetical protein
MLYGHQKGQMKEWMRTHFEKLKGNEKSVKFLYSSNEQCSLRLIQQALSFLQMSSAVI